MKKLALLLFLAAELVACQSGQAPGQRALLQEITKLEKQLVKTQDASKDQAAANLLVEKTLEFAQAFPQDTLTPGLLFKAGDVANGAGDYGKAIQLWGQLWRGYEKHPKAPMALFLQGFTYDSKLQDSKMATKYYKQFLQKFPKDPLAEQVKQLIGVVEIEPGKLIEQFETK